MIKVNRRLYIDGGNDSLSALKELAPWGIGFKIVDVREFGNHEFNELPVLVADEGEFSGITQIKDYVAMIETARWGFEKGK